MATIGKIAAYMEELAPLHWAESWDNVGLQLGAPDRPVRQILTALELTGGVVEEAMQAQADLVIVHHPAIFTPLKALRFDDPAGQRLERLIKANIGLYAAHTNLDVAPGGTNDTLAAAAGLALHEVLFKAGAESYLKLVVFVPKSHVEAVRTALAEAGAGQIGGYSHCTFFASGTGTFLPHEGTKPFIGEQGRLEYVDEYRLETILPARQKALVIRALLCAHPYEEVAYDLYPLANDGEVRGHGRIGRLEQATTLGSMAGRMKAAIGIPHLRVVGDLGRKVQTIAVGAGSGGFLIPVAAQRQADVLITGDVKYHEAQDALDAGMAVIDVGHYGSEQIVVRPLAAYLRRRLAADGLAAQVVEAQAGRDPFRFA